MSEVRDQVSEIEEAPTVGGRGRLRRVRTRLGRHVRGQASWWLAMLVTFGYLTVQLMYLSVPVPSDQTHYLEAARQFPVPSGYGPIAHQYMRFGLTAPTALAIAVFGYSQAAYFTVPLLASLLLMLGVYALGCQLFNRWVGAAAAVLVTANTLIFEKTTQMLPDVLATATFTAAVALAVAVRQQRWKPVTSLRGRFAALLVIGGLLAWSYLAREFIILVWPLVPVLLWRRVGLRGLLVVAAPMMAVWLAESATLWAVYGDPLARLKTAVTHGSGTSPPEIARTYRNKPLHVYLLRLPHVLRQTPEGWALVAALVATVVAGIARPRRFGFLLLWVALLWVPLTLLGGVLNPEAPKLRLQLERYWFPVFPAFILGGVGTAWFLARAVVQRWGARVRALGAVPVAAALVAGMAPAAWAGAHWYDSPGYRVNGATDLERFRAWMDEHGDEVGTVWTDARTWELLRIFRNGFFGGRVWDNELGQLREPDTEPTRGDIVVVFSANSSRCGRCREHIHEQLGDPLRIPRTWQQIREPRDSVVTVYKVT